MSRLLAGVLRIVDWFGRYFTLRQLLDDTTSFSPMGLWRLVSGGAGALVANSFWGWVWALVVFYAIAGLAFNFWNQHQLSRPGARAVKGRPSDNWTGFYRQNSPGAEVVVGIRSDGDMRVVKSCSVKAPIRRWAVAKRRRREREAVLEARFVYPADFKGKLPTMPLADGNYKAQWDDISRLPIHLGRFEIRNGRLVP
ncbi:hypothetical protein BH18ACT15_BH18ACT15_05680 [soil metagenome]